LQRKKQVANKKSIADILKIGLQSAWYKRGLLSFLIITLLWPLSQGYKFLAFTHRQLYKFGILKARKVSIPVVVVGNIVAGGGGKTPTVIALVRHLQAQGIRVGVISRGYGRTSTQCLEVKHDSAISDVGDEPAGVLLALDFTASSAPNFIAPIFVSNSRFEAASSLLKTYPTTQVIISDDGLQHHALQHDIAITVFDDRGLGNGLRLPAGPLRESAGSLRESAMKERNSLVLHTGNQAVKLTNMATPQFTASRALTSYALKADGSRVNLSDLEKNNKLLALAGIANPEAFFDMLRAQGLNLAQTLPLPDHYNFNSASGSKYAGYTLICTVKDAVKLWAEHPDALAVPLEFEPEAAFFTAFDAMLKLRLHPSLL
jgi:tetraacyldisaccharide 4'-kinase